MRGCTSQPGFLSDELNLGHGAFGVLISCAARAPDTCFTSIVSAVQPGVHWLSGYKPSSSWEHCRKASLHGRDDAL